MRLLLDEMFSPTIAEQLRQRGYDVVAVAERVDLRTRSDRELVATARMEDRAIVTANIDDFRILAAPELGSERPFPKLILITDRAFPRGNARTPGRMVAALDALLAADEPPEAEHFLR